MTPYVEYCRTNVDVTARTRLGTLDATVVEKPCLRRCGVCHVDPFLVVDGEPRRSESHEQLVATLADEGEARSR